MIMTPLSLYVSIELTLFVIMQIPSNYSPWKPHQMQFHLFYSLTWWNGICCQAQAFNYSDFDESCVPEWQRDFQHYEISSFDINPPFCVVKVFLLLLYPLWLHFTFYSFHNDSIVACFPKKHTFAFFGKHATLLSLISKLRNEYKVKCSQSG